MESNKLFFPPTARDEIYLMVKFQPTRTTGASTVCKLGAETLRSIILPPPERYQGPIFSGTFCVG